MLNDEKLGMVCGLGLLIAVAIFLVRKDASASGTAAQLPRATAQVKEGWRTRPTQQLSGAPLRRLEP
jgi:hypothetical protein